MGDILGDPEAVSRVGRKGSTKVFKDGRQSPWVPTLTGTLRMLTLIGHKNALYYCAQSAKSISWVFFREFVHDSYRLDHSWSVSCTKEMHTVRKLSIWYKLPISNTVYPKTKDAFPVTCVAWRFCREQSPRGFSALTRLSYFARPCYAGYFSKNTSLSLQQEFTLTATKTSHEKWGWVHIFWVSIVITPTRLLCQMQANSSGADLLSTISKLIKRKKILSLLVYVLHKLVL